ncbi:MAG TPA: beta-N-acetylhexosaminidase, partial [Thermomicrobiales bacterium]|nr:beta-N-acetylhexosaminidase [Thermomicrobiales bacterium]
MAQPASPTDLVFLPYPRSAERLGDAQRCDIDLGTRIVVGSGAGAETSHAAGTIRAAIRELVGIDVPVTPLEAAAGDRPIRLVRTGRDKVPTGGAGESPADLGVEGYTLTIDGDGVVILAATEAGLFYGAQTLIQVIQQAGRRLPGLRIGDEPVLPNRGLMLDVSRNKVYTPETLEKLIRRLAHYKYNQLQLYTEHTFASREHPAIAPDVGGLTPNDLLRLDALCRQHHIDLVPNWQSLGHQRTMLENPRYAHLAETEWRWSFASGSDEAFETVEEIYADLLPNFSSRYFNIDADEPWDMGLGVSKARTDEIGAGRVYIEHITRLHGIVSRHDRTMMMWADVFWHHPELVSELPDDIVLLDWWYEPKERYDTVEALEGRRFYVCPGSGAWLSLFPRTERAIANVQGFVRDGVAAGAEGMLMTDWGDFGHFTMLENTWYLYLWAAECGWNGAQTAIGDYDNAVSCLFYRDPGGQQVAAMRALGAAIAPIDGDWRSIMATGPMFWGDPLDRRATKAISRDHMVAIREAANAIFPLLDSVR